jgi:predicted benzoate:H+ symporter BenE
MSTHPGTTFAFVMSLIGGLIILIASTVNLVWFLSGAQNFGGFGNYIQGFMDGNHNFMGSYANSNGFLAGISVVAVVCGVIVLIGALMLRVQPRDHTIWAIIIVVFSGISFVGMGGYFIGAIIGLIGGVFELSIRQIHQ